MDPARRRPGPAVPGRDRPGADAGSSTPNWPAACSATSGWPWARWSSSTWASGWRRGTPPPTGAPARCPATGWSTPPWTSNCWSRCATCSRPNCARRARWSGRCRSSRPSAWRRPSRPAVDPWRRTSGHAQAAQRRQLAAVRALWTSRDEFAAAARHRPRTRPARRRDHRGRPVRGRRRAERPGQAAGVRRTAAEAPGPTLARRARGGLGPARRRTAAGHRRTAATACPRRRAGANATRRRPTGSTRCRAVVAELAETAHRARAEPAGLRRGAPAVVGAAGRDRRRPGSRARLAELGARPWQIALTVEPLVAALNSTP